MAVLLISRRAVQVLHQSGPQLVEVGQAQLGVNPLQRLQRTPLQVFVPNLAQMPGRNAVAVEEVLPMHFTVDPQNPLIVPVQVGRCLQLAERPDLLPQPLCRPEHVVRIPVHVHKPGFREDREQPPHPAGVRGRLQDSGPPMRRFQLATEPQQVLLPDLPLRRTQLVQSPVSLIVVDAPRERPAHVGRHLVHRHLGPFILLRRIGPHRHVVHRSRRWHQRLQDPPQPALRQLERLRKVHLVHRRMAKPLVQRQQVVQVRGPRPEVPQDEQGRRDRHIRQSPTVDQVFKRLNRRCQRRNSRDERRSRKILRSDREPFPGQQAQPVAKVDPREPAGTTGRVHPVAKIGHDSSVWWGAVRQDRSLSETSAVGQAALFA